MKRLLTFGLVPLLALVLLLGVVGLAAAQQPEPTATPAPQATPSAQYPPYGYGMGSIFPELRGLTPDQRFDRLRSAQYTIADAQGNAVVYMMTPGTVAGLSNNTLSVTPNGASQPVDFTITSDTVIHAMPNPGQTQALVQGDKVLVITRQNSTDAMAIMKHYPAGMHRPYMNGGPGYGPGPMAPQSDVPFSEVANVPFSDIALAGN